MERIDILKNSLIKKQKTLEKKFEEHFATVKKANGQPLNDKRNGAATISKWERQNESIRAVKKSIEITTRAIEIEEDKIAGCNIVKKELPKAILSRIESGLLIQWKKHPETFFVDGVDKVRIVFDKKKKIIGHRYKNEVTDAEQWRKFAQVYNQIYNEILKENE